MVPSCGLSSRRHRHGFELGIYGFMFVCLREFVFVVFGLWVRGKKYDIWSGKERKYGQWVRERKKKRKKKERDLECGIEQIWAMGKAK